MAKKDNNNNLLYATLVCIGLLLVVIPFFVFEISGTAALSVHLKRFGIHILAFGSAIAAGSLFSAAITKIGSSALTMKITAVATTMILGIGVAYNAIQYSQKNSSTNNVISNSTIEIKNNDTTATISDSINSINPVTTDSNSQVIPETENHLTETKENKADLTIDKKPISVNKDTSSVSKEKYLKDKCKKFNIIHGSKPLDLKQGLSIYDPNKTIRFDNSCGGILKKVKISHHRGQKILESKIQNGNDINLSEFKQVNTGDYLQIEIAEASFKNSNGKEYKYSFPELISNKILISNYKNFEGAEIKKNKTPYVPEPDNQDPSNTNTKDKVEEELNKYEN